MPLVKYTEELLNKFSKTESGREKINLLIASIDGVNEVEPWLNGRRCFVKKHKGKSSTLELEDIPDFTNDLTNVMLVFSRLNKKDRQKVTVWLCQRLAIQTILRGSMMFAFEEALLSVSALERCIAILMAVQPKTVLRTNGKAPKEPSEFGGVRRWSKRPPVPLEDDEEED